MLMNIHENKSSDNRHAKRQFLIYILSYMYFILEALPLCFCSFFLMQMFRGGLGSWERSVSKTFDFLHVASNENMSEISIILLLGPSAPEIAESSPI